MKYKWTKVKRDRLEALYRSGATINAMIDELQESKWDIKEKLLKMGFPVSALSKRRGL